MSPFHGSDMLVKYESKKSNNMSTIYGKVCFNSKIHVNFDFILFSLLLEDK